MLQQAAVSTPEWLSQMIVRFFGLETFDGEFGQLPGPFAAQCAV